MEKVLFFLFAFALFPAYYCSSCPSNSGLSEYAERLENATQAAIANILELIPGLPTNRANEGPSNTTALYVALTASLNITATAEGLSNFSMVLDVITDSYFKSCYGSVDERPTIEESQAILNEFVTILDNQTDYTRAREIFGRLLCLQNFGTSPNDTSSSSRKKRADVDLLACARTSSIRKLYDCLDQQDQLDCIFNINRFRRCPGRGPNSPTSSQSSQRNNCLGFVVDTTGSMSEELAHVKTVIQRFIASEENGLTFCYVLVPFNDYSMPPWPNLGNLDFGRIYDSNCISSDPSCTFTTRDGSQVLGTDILLQNVNSLIANGGGDCPEYGMTGILKAMDLINNVDNTFVRVTGRHNIIVLTDASAKDNSLYQQVINTAIEKGNPMVTIHFFYSGSGCSDGFGNYDNIKNATNGQSVNQIDAANFQTFVDYIVALRSATFSPPTNRRKRTTGSCQYFQISVFTTRFSVLFETAASSIIVTRPDNTTESVSKFTNSLTGIYTVSSNPQPGNWRACVATGQTLTQNLAVTVDIELNVEYLKESNDGTLLPTAQQPFACDTHTFIVSSPDLVNVSLAQNVYLDVIDNGGNVLQTAQLFECAGYLSGSVRLPYGFVQYQLRAHDIRGTPFTHLIPNSIIEFDNHELQASLNLLSITTAVILNQGQGSLVRLSIRNTKRGPQTLQASVSVNISSGIETQFITDNSVTLLPQQDSNELLFMLNTPSSIAIGQQLTWSITITDDCSEYELDYATIVNFTAIVKKVIPLNVTKSATTISFEWLPPPIEDGSNITNYTLTVDYTNGTVATMTLYGTAKQYTLTGLLPYQQVYAIIVANVDSGETIETTQMSILTDESEPGPVSQLMTRPLSSNSVVVQWSLPLQRNGIILYYELSIIGLNDTIHNASTTSVTIDSLEPYVRYTAIVSAATSVGKGEPITIEFYSMEGIPEESPNYISHTITSPSSLIFRWSPPSVEDRNGFITRYTVLVVYAEGRKEYTTDNNTVVNIIGVPDFADLNVSVSASTSAGQGPFNDPVTIHITTGVPSAPRSFAVNASNSTAVQMSWNSPQYPNGRILHYQLYYIHLRVNSTVKNVTVRNFYSIRGLQSNDDYQFFIAAVNYEGHGMNSTPVYITLPASVGAGVNIVAAVLPMICLLMIAIITVMV